MSGGRPTLIIEAVGLPGSGKTTICHALKQALVAEGIAVGDLVSYLGDASKSLLHRHVLRAKYIMYALVRKPGAVLAAARLVYHSRQESLRDAAKVLWNIVAITGWYQWLRDADHTHAVVLADQGLVQAIWSIRLTAIRQDACWSGMLKDLGLAQVRVISIQADAETARKRLQDRLNGPSRMNGYIGKSHEEQWLRAQQILADLNNQIRARMPEAILIDVTNDGSCSPGDLARAIVPWALNAASTVT